MTKATEAPAARWRKRPVVVDARQLLDDLRNHTAVASWIEENGGQAEIPFAEPCLYIETLEGRMRADIGDWIIRGVKGEFYPCKADIFAATYEPAQTPERDLQAEQDFAEWRGWMEAQGYGFDDDSYQAEAFAAGMQAARDLAAVTAQTPERDLQAEQDFAEWRGWMEAQGYGFDDDSYQAEAFAAGMQAARDLAAVTAQTPERDTRAETLAKIACEAFCTADVAEAGRDRSQARWEAAALAVAAHVVNPTAQDYDNSAEIMRLRDLVAEILADFWAPERFEGISEGLRDAQARVDDYRERAGLERQQ